MTGPAARHCINPRLARDLILAFVILTGPDTPCCPSSNTRTRPREASRGKARGSGAHAQALGIEQRFVESNRLAALADDLDLEARVRRTQRRRDIAQRHRLPRRMGIAARRDPADHLAVVPHRLVADRVGPVGIDRERYQPALSTRSAFLCRRFAPDEVVLLQV